MKIIQINPKDCYCIPCILHKGKLSSKIEFDTVKIKCPTCGSRDREINGKDLKEMLLKVQALLKYAEIS